jgi:mannosyl-3-phosphoglycerate phosphatase
MSGPIILTDIDQFIRDNAWDALRPGIAAARDAGAPLILSSWMTRAELEPARAELGHVDPFIVENGGALYIPDGTFAFEFDADRTLDGLQCMIFGTAREQIDGVVDQIAQSSYNGLTGFHALSLEEIQEHAGLSAEQAAVAREREFTEAVVILRDDRRTRVTLKNLVQDAGLLWEEKRDLILVQGATEPASAARLVIQLYHNVDPLRTTASVGSGTADLRLMQITDQPVLFGDDTEIDAGLAGQFQNLSVVNEGGPTGWCSAVESLLND